MPDTRIRNSHFPNDREFWQVVAVSLNASRKVIMSVSVTRRITPLIAVMFLTLCAPSAYGAEWTIKSVGLPTGGTQGELRGVSCFSSTDCTAVGHYFNGSIWGADGNEWSGTSWKTASVVANPGEKNGNLWAVSCPTESLCQAVGGYGIEKEGRRIIVTLSEFSEKGKWGHVSTPQPLWQSEFYGIDCLSASYCIATGHDQNPPSNEHWGAIAQEWGFEKWRALEPIWNPGSQRNAKLRGISCTERVCTIAGGWGFGEGEEYLGLTGGVERMSGGQLEGEWSDERVGGPSEGEFYGIACPKANSCITVGALLLSGQPASLVAYQWNGSTWKQMTISAPSGSILSNLYSISCVSETECYAAGFYRNSSKVFKTLVEEWNGTTWKVLTTPSEAAGNQLEAISCPAKEVCEAVGHYYNSENVPRPLAESYK